MLASSYCESTGLSLARVSTLIFNHGSRLKNISDGAGLTVASAEKATSWFSDHWPDDLPWPSDIPRPVSNGEAAA